MLTASSVRTRAAEREEAGSGPRLSLSGLLLLPAAVFVLFVAVPLAALVWRAAQSGQLLDSLSQPAIRDALRLSLTTSALTAVIVIVLGTPLAYVLARHAFPGKALIDTLVDLPMVLPPV